MHTFANFLLSPECGDQSFWSISGQTGYYFKPNNQHPMREILNLWIQIGLTNMTSIFCLPSCKLSLIWGKKKESPDIFFFSQWIFIDIYLVLFSLDTNVACSVRADCPNDLRSLLASH